ncbi:MAG: NYN domain-containing protein [Firmicutes bacterium]|nr:NYN domain-containing protein [Bacillota bacterium]
MSRKVTIGIVAHVDAGKTTLSEALLYLTGEIKKPGRVDHGDAFLDDDKVERNRGITVFSNQARFRISGDGDDVEVTLIDTPGHVDFQAETERTLSVLDYALLVISGSEGIQPQTKALYRMLREKGIPVFIFVNKMDITVRPKEDLIDDLRNEMGMDAVDFSDSSERPDGFIDDLTLFSAMLTEAALEGGEGTDGISDMQIAEAVAAGEIVPVMFGSALRLEGVDGLLEVLRRYTAAPVYKEKFGAVIYKTTTARDGERLCFIRITGGNLAVRESVTVRSLNGDNDGREAKINQIRLYSGSRFEKADRAEAGTVCAVTGLGKAFPGDSLGEEEPVSYSTEPFMVYSVKGPSGMDPHDLMEDMQVLTGEDPALHASWSTDGREVEIRLMGEVQMEILQSVIKERFGYDVSFESGSVLYLETISGTYEGVGHFEPLRHYAEVHLIIEPGERGSGVVITSDVPEDDLAVNWQRLILTHLAEKEHTGVLTGAPVTDVKISLAAGRAHDKHTEGGDFREATYRAVRNALMQAKRDGKALLLEPWCEYELELPAQNSGRALTDINQMGASQDSLEQKGDTAVIRGKAPSELMAAYHRTLIAYTSGTGRLTMTQRGYDVCHNADEVIDETGYVAERDINNPADSVFVNHKGSDIVPWEEVPEHMHLASVLKKDKSGAGENDAYGAASRSMKTGAPGEAFFGEKIDAKEAERRRIAAEKELEKIFERTYGPVKNRHHIEKKEMDFSAGEDISEEEFARRQERNKQIRAQHEKKKPEANDGTLILIDGYNLIFSDSHLKELADKDIGSARDSLVERLINYAGYTGFKVSVIFDAYKVVPGDGSTEKHSVVDVIYTAANESADVRIGRMAGKAKEGQIYVVTSDELVQQNVWTQGALRVSSREFIKLLEHTEEEIRSML